MQVHAVWVCECVGVCSACVYVVNRPGQCVGGGGGKDKGEGGGCTRELERPEEMTLSL